MTAVNTGAPKALPKQAWDACAAAAKAVGLEPALIRAVCWVESRGNPRAQSPKGAIGLMQLMPPTAAQMGVKNIFDANENALGGARYRGEMLVRFGSIEHMLAAYNWGPGNVERVKVGAAHLPSSVLQYVASVQARWEVERTFSGPFQGPPPPLPAAAVRSRGSRPRSSRGSSSGTDGDDDGSQT
jgi:soluble lytic murein transglycosylase-like protein